MPNKLISLIVIFIIQITKNIPNSEIGIPIATQNDNLVFKNNPKRKITKDNEHILFIKTQAKRYPELEKALVKAHPYEVPEVLAIPIIQGFEKYMNWLKEETDPDK